MKKANKIPKDWHGPMKALAKLLREEHGIKTVWNSWLVKHIMLWSFEHILFHKIHHGKKKNGNRSRP